MHELFRAKLAERKQHANYLIEAQKALTAEFESAIMNRVRELSPRRKLTPQKAKDILGDEYTVIFDAFKARADAIMDEWLWMRDCLDEELRLMANSATPLSGDWRLYKQVSGSDYHTQGFGANSYAETSAKLTALELNALGHEAEIRIVDTRRISSPHIYDTGPVQTFGVFVKALEELDLEIIKRQSGKLSFRDWLKACWKAGSNPRVFAPGLPFGLEGKLGIDYQGNDLR